MVRCRGGRSNRLRLSSHIPPLFYPKVRRSNKRGQSIRLATDDPFAPPQRSYGYENVEGVANNKFMDTVRKTWAAVPSLRKSLEVSPSKSDFAVEERNANGDDV